MIDGHLKYQGVSPGMVAYEILGRGVTGGFAVDADVSVIRSLVGDLFTNTNLHYSGNSIHFGGHAILADDGFRAQIRAQIGYYSIDITQNDTIIPLLEFISILEKYKP